MPCSTSSTRRWEPVVRSAQSISCRSDSSSPRADRAALPLRLAAVEPRRLRRSGSRRGRRRPGGSRWRWATVMGPSCRIVVEPPPSSSRRRRTPAPRGSPCGRAARPAAGSRWSRSTPRSDAQLLADQRPGGLLLVGGVELVERRRGRSRRRRPCGAAPGPAPGGPGPGCAAGSPPRPGRRPRRRPARPPRTGRAAARRARRGRRAWPACRAARWRLRAWPVSCVEQDLAGHRLRVGVRPSAPGRRRDRTAPQARRRPGGRRPPVRRRRDQPVAASDRRRGSEVIDADRLVGQRRSAGASTVGPTPSFSRIRFSSSLARSGLSRRKARAFSLPWPSWSPS